VLSLVPIFLSPQNFGKLVLIPGAQPGKFPCLILLSGEVSQFLKCCFLENWDVDIAHPEYHFGGTRCEAQIIIG
jgi:hypothetical protein